MVLGKLIFVLLVVQDKIHGQDYPYRATTFGEKCIFPFEEQGQQYTDCIVAGDDLEYCKVDDIFYECLPPVEELNQANQKPQHRPQVPLDLEIIERFTRSGDKCKLPIFLKNKWLGDCIKVSDTRQLCYANDKWQFCAARDEEQVDKNDTNKQDIMRFTLDGAPCTIPFTFGQKEFYDCVDFGDGNEMCRVNGEWKTCTSTEGSDNQDVGVGMGAVGATPTIGGFTRPWSSTSIPMQGYQMGGYLYDYQMDNQLQQEKQESQSGDTEDGSSNVAIIILIVVVVVVLLGLGVGVYVYFRMRRITGNSNKNDATI
eukprot:TRINITY_DN1408_c0_g2_i2.p2 TRINITY_DN1408_c0_g2~~TRINITY_DN1408_c0_g2_i2.p2  ORF type:complete len:342 (-),score=26.67 TRINITY_DN1408_c0_g2_i2:206-1144(-)